MCVYVCTCVYICADLRSIKMISKLTRRETKLVIPKNRTGLRVQAAYLF